LSVPATVASRRGALIALVVGFVLAVGVCEAALRIAMPHWREFYSGRFMQEAYVPGYGFVMTGRPSFDGRFAQNNGDFRVRIVLNELGLRDSAPPSSAGGRIWVVGDSMAFGWGVEADETYASVVERSSGKPVYNVTSPGSDICGYAALIARMPKGAPPRAVVVGLVLENDMQIYSCPRGTAPPEPPRPVRAADADGSDPITFERAKYFLTGESALYNFFAVTVKRIGALNEALVAIGAIEREHRLRNRPDATELSALVASTADELAVLKTMLPAETPVAVLVAPARFDIRDSDPVFRRMRLEMVRAIAARGLDPIDPFDAFAKMGFEATHFPHDGHWSAVGHRIAGEAVAAWVKANVI
jgi:hypothetical protein